MLMFLAEMHAMITNSWNAFWDEYDPNKYEVTEAQIWQILY